MKYVAWSGGFDSTYIVMKHVLNGETVQPIYSYLRPIDTHFFRDVRQLNAIEYFRSKYPNNILKPMTFDLKKFYTNNKENIDVLKEEIYNLEDENKNHYLAQDGLIYEKMVFDNGNFIITDSNNKTFILKRNSIDQTVFSKQDMSTLLKYYFPLFPKIEECQFLGTWINLFLFPLIEYSNKIDIKIEYCCHEGCFITTEPMRKWLGINEKMQIADSRYKQLRNLIFPLHDKNKFQMAEDLKQIDFDLFLDIVDNCASCIGPQNRIKNNSNYCFGCTSCASMIRNKVFLMSNLEKIKRSSSRK